MSNARYIQSFRRRLDRDPEHKEARRDFHEAYEWLEGYWRTAWTSQSDQEGFITFCEKLGPHFWEFSSLRELAGRLVCEAPVGNSRNNYQVSDKMLSATLFLLDEVDSELKATKVDLIESFRARFGNRYDLKDVEKWNHNTFHALMHIVRQIRNNLFHGRKMEVESLQYERNKRLVTLARDISLLLLDKLVEVEQDYRDSRGD